MAALAPEILTTIGDFPITNTILATILIDVIFIALIFLIARHIKKVPGKLQNITETVFSYFFSMASDMAGNKRAQSIFPWVMTFFLFIVFSNFLGLLPGIGSIGINEKETHAIINEEQRVQEDEEHTPAGTPKETDSSAAHTETATEETENGGHHLVTLLRPATSDFNATLALATISLFATHALGIRYTGLKDYLKRFFSLNPILLFVGMLELVSEFIKIFSLSFRLFGNIYAGEVVLATISGLFAFLAPLPFLLLESIVAVVQALVFAILTMVFMTMLTEKHSEGGDH